MELLQTLCSIHAPSGNEVGLKDFLLDYAARHQSGWKVQPKIITGEDLQDSMIWIFGTPRTAVFAHMDSIGFTVRYDNRLVRIGGPKVESGYMLIGHDSQGVIEGPLVVDVEHDELRIEFHRPIDRGTELVFKPDFRESESYVQCCYMDNRLGVWNALQLAETLEHGAIVFSCWEEHGGGSVGYLARLLYEQYQVRQALISDITWVTDGVPQGKGVVVSLRDRGIPRRSFVQKVVKIAEASGIPYQLEVEGAGSSDGGYLQASPYPFDWCFVGAPEDHVHSPDEIVHKADITAMVELYKVLMRQL